MSKLVRAARSARDRGRSAAVTARHTTRDRVRRAEWRQQVLASGIIDREWLGIQLRRALASDEEAVDAYLDNWRYCSPHPLFESSWLAISGTDDWEPLELSPLIWYLANREARRHRSPHPLFDLKVLRAQHAQADPAPEHPSGPLARWLDTATDETLLPTPSGFEPTTLAEFRASALKAAETHSVASGLLAARRITPFMPTPPVHRAGFDVDHPAGADDGPVVTVIVPSWNRADRLRAAITSVQAQHLSNWELLVVDDGSTDDTANVVAGIAAFDSRVRYVGLPHGGVCRARNEGIAQARGRYLAFLDSDNVWAPDFLGSMVEELEVNGWAMAHAAMRLVRPNDEVSYRAFEGTYDHLLQQNHIDLNVLVVRADAVREVGGFDESLRRGVDHDLLLSLARQHDLHLVPSIGAEYQDGDEDLHRISNSQPVGWLSAVLQKHLLDWEAEASRERQPGLTSVIVPARIGASRIIEWMQSGALTPGTELVFVGLRTNRSLNSIAATTAAASGGRVVWKYISSDVNESAAQNIGFAASHGDRVVYAINHVVPDVPTLATLAKALDDPAIAVAQPLLVDSDGLVISAGAIFGPSGVRPQPFLRGHHQRDAQEAGPAVEVPAILCPVFAARASDVIALRGVDPVVGLSLAEVDFSMRARELGTAVTCPGTVVRFSRKEYLPRLAYIAGVDVLETKWAAAPSGSTDAYVRAGFDVVHHRNEPLARETKAPTSPAPLDRPLLVPRPLVLPRLEISESGPQLRWTIDIAAPAGQRGETWGDTHFARSLAASLERLGQRVAVDNRSLRHRASRDLDDVIVVLRGLDRVAPRPGAVNMQWIISHPDMVTADEVAGFDAVFAASLSWSAAMSAAWGIRIDPLLQCTDAALFRPDRFDSTASHDVLFVGNSRGIYRRALRSALAVGADVTLYGGDWARVLPQAKVAAKHVPNVELGRLYSSAGVVLNDHWDDMRRDGFISNRLFDAAASGARIISDEVDGLADIFGAQVQTFRSDEDMRDILKRQDELFPSAEDLRASAERVRGEHSFDHRAEQLLEAAARLHQR